MKDERILDDINLQRRSFQHDNSNARRPIKRMHTQEGKIEQQRGQIWVNLTQIPQQLHTKMTIITHEDLNNFTHR